MPVAAACALLLPGCGSGDVPDAAGRAFIREKDFKIGAPPTLPAGKVDLSVDNTGPDDHELIVVRASGALPRRTDGVTINEDAIESETVGVLEPGIGNRHLVLSLRPGSYEMFCNMQGHYLGGMHRTFRVG